MEDEQETERERNRPEGVKDRSGVLQLTLRESSGSSGWSKASSDFTSARVQIEIGKREIKKREREKERER